MRSKILLFLLWGFLLTGATHLPQPMKIREMKELFIEVSACMPMIKDITVLSFQLPYKPNFFMRFRNMQNVRKFEIGPDFEGLGVYTLDDGKTKGDYYLGIQHGDITLEPINRNGDIKIDVDKAWIVGYEPDSHQVTDEELTVLLPGHDDFRKGAEKAVERYNPESSPKTTNNFLMFSKTFNRIRAAYSPRSQTILTHGPMKYLISVGRPANSDSSDYHPTEAIYRTINFHTYAVDTNKYQIKDFLPLQFNTAYLRNYPFCSNLVEHQKNVLKMVEERTEVTEFRMTARQFYQYIQAAVPSCEEESDRPGVLFFSEKVHYSISCDKDNPTRYQIEGTISYDNDIYQNGNFDGNVLKFNHRDSGSSPMRTIHKARNAEVILMGNSKPLPAKNPQKTVDFIDLRFLGKIISDANQALTLCVCFNRKFRITRSRIEYRGLNIQLYCSSSPYVTENAAKIKVKRDSKVLRIDSTGKAFEASGHPVILYHLSANVFTAIDEEYETTVYGLKVITDVKADEPVLNALVEGNIVLKTLYQKLLLEPKNNQMGVVRIDKNRKLITCKTLKFEESSEFYLEVTGEFQPDLDVGFKSTTMYVKFVVNREKEHLTGPKYISAPYERSFLVDGLKNHILHIRVEKGLFQQNYLTPSPVIYQYATAENLDKMFTLIVKQIQENECTNNQNVPRTIALEISTDHYFHGLFNCNYGALHMNIPTNAAILKGYFGITSIAESWVVLTYTADSKLFTPDYAAQNIFAYLVPSVPGYKNHQWNEENNKRTACLPDGTYTYYVVLGDQELKLVPPLLEKTRSIPQETAQPPFQPGGIPQRPAQPSGLQPTAARRTGGTKRKNQDPHV